VRHRRARQGIAVCIIGSALALAPLTAASAKKHSPARHGPSTATVCTDVRSEQRSSALVGLSVERALDSRNFTAAKQAMLGAYDTDLSNVAKANAVIAQAPANVQAAFRDLLGFVQQIKADIQNAHGEQQLLASFETLSQNPKVATDSTTISNWFSSKCGGSISTTTSSGHP
jgi:hypothetical protein